MAQQSIQIGSSPNDGTGDPLRAAFDKINDNFTELYSLSPPSAALLADGTVDSTGDQVFTKHVAIGGDAANDSKTILSLAETRTAVAFNETSKGIDVIFTVDGGQILTKPTGMNFTQVLDGAGNSPAGVAINAITRQTASQSDPSVSKGFVSVFRTEVGAADYSDVKHFTAGQGAYSGGVPVVATGFFADNQGVSGGTDAFGIQVIKQAGSTNNYGIWLKGDNMGAEITFGSGNDNSIYHDGTRLRIDGLTDSAITTETLSRFIEINIGGTLRKVAIVA